MRPKRCKWKAIIRLKKQNKPIKEKENPLEIVKKSESTAQLSNTKRAESLKRIMIESFQ